MPRPCYVSVQGEKQGKIEGSCDTKDHEKKIECYALEHTIMIPTNPDSGAPSGNRRHGQLSITKQIDMSTPKLNQALCDGEKLKKVEIDYFRVAKDGKEELYYQAILENAAVVSISPYIPNTLQKENGLFGHMEKVAFTYGKIKWKWVPDGVEAEDAWSAN